MKNIPDLIKAREAEMASVISSHDAFWRKEQAELQALKERFDAKQAAMQQKGSENQLKLTSLEGMIKQLRELLPTAKKPK